ncbi:MAG: S-methyl-5-thioribose-1-phosphate isomerase [candidate division Zixibacteria bacterium]|nr:S-methyl-5-thioribose-1-phosphate isomerase [candidate division Zixibacteria bacterium]MDH3936334.1 S-methyl-5-thioribose-1-phosphate isomerase [candidate division Zixibacteria bacterium]MDH4035310.1 S-methyl-5-thioribose-1-phosphate isomerase [candidate division Zixibacteria bacterium]
MNFSTIRRQDNKVVILAQTRLPAEEKYLELEDYRDVVEAIKCLDVRGAPAIGIAAAYGMALAVHQTGRFDAEFVEEVARRFKDSRPTAVNLFWAVDRMLNKASQLPTEEIHDTLSALWAEAEAIHEEDRSMCRQIGKHGATLINDGDAILTHCNAGALATGGIGTALGVIYTAHDQGKKMQVYADETRPLLQGARLTVWELMRAGIDVTLICDNTAGMLMKQGEINHVIVGADRIAKNGDFANKIGTYSLAVLAEHHDVPFYVAAPASTFDDETETGDDIVIEERSPHEVTEGFGDRTAPDDAHVYSPAFDVTPLALVTSFITDNGVKPGGRKEK